MPRTANFIFVGVVCVAVAMTAAVVVSHSLMTAESHANVGLVAQPVTPGSLSDQIANESKSDDDQDAAASLFPVNVRAPSGPPRIELTGMDPQGRSGSVACSTCHAVRKPNTENVSAETLDEFHQGMTFNHGTITCYACHNPGDADSLRLANGTSVSYQNVMTLCSQCHGRQATAFSHGAHGGMSGHWDLTRGPQMKNNCIDCHDPHEPSYTKMIVGFKPKDRFNAPLDHDHEPEGADLHGDH